MLQSSSIHPVNHTSRPLRTQLRPGQRKRFLAVCWEMVLAPRGFRFRFSESFIALSMASRSNPQWLTKFWSSEAMTASWRFGDIFFIPTQSCFIRISFPAAACWTVRITINGVTGTGNHLNSSTKRSVSPMNQAEAFTKNRNILRNIVFKRHSFF